ncbi:GNAT family N-acetyltransferase [Bacillus sp. AFS017336]|uniref:GNAT family N-acetyltransferase n=1 Tax=Bacillus sp. AFS017336 TaxID=2033489 RepID=UPI000BF1848D|nr:GNAT family N-acetyltransferase [Bacillus sp. AFS017336]PEL13271.1 GNAT family N-acetyltransferase [Bacillus sp. AFS017336]
MEIRKLTLEDLPEFIRLRKEGLILSPEAFGESISEYELKTMEQHTNNFPKTFDNFIVGAFDEKELVGVAGFYQKRSEKMKHKGTVWGMYVNPNYRGKGVGKKVLSQAIQHATQIEDILQIELAVISANVSAKKLYESVGFESFGTEKRALFVNGEFYDEDHMVKIIK